MKRRPLFFVLAAVGLVVWKGGFGYLASERTLLFRFPVSFGDVRRVELQLWDEGSLIKRVVEESPSGLTLEPTLRVPLARGSYRAIGIVWLSAEPRSRTFQIDFDPKADDEVVLSFGR